MSKLTSKQWSTHWTRGSITTLSSMFEANYDGAVAQYWHSVLNCEPAIVVDLACGNGALTWLANEFLNAKKVCSKVIGVDAATINPFSTLGRDQSDYPAIQFIPDTPIENLPFESGSIDVAISQYGVEYSNLQRSIPEIARVLKSRSTMGFIVHGEESVVVTGSTGQLADHKYVLQKIKVHNLFLELDALVGKSRDLQSITGKPKIRKKMLEVDSAMTEIKKIIDRSPAPSELVRYYTTMHGAFSIESVNNGVNRKKIIYRSLATLQDFIKRIEDLESATLSLKEQDEIVQLIEGQGFKIVERRALAYANSSNIGTAITAVRED